MHGKLIVENLTRGIKVELTIHRIGWTKKNAYKVEGNVIDQNGVPKFSINGLWNKSLSLKDLKTGKEEIVFEVEPRPANQER